MDPEQERPRPSPFVRFTDNYARSSEQNSQLDGALIKLGVKCVNETVIRGMELSSREANTRDKSYPRYIFRNFFFSGKRKSDTETILRNFCLDKLSQHTIDSNIYITMQ